MIFPQMKEDNTDNTNSPTVVIGRSGGGGGGCRQVTERTFDSNDTKACNSFTEMRRSRFIVTRSKAACCMHSLLQLIK